MADDRRDDDRRDDDRRDDDLAARLDVDPLDDVTRRRLVRRALSDSAPARDGATARGADRSLLTRMVAAAAVLIVVAVGVIALLALPDSGSDTTQAGRARSSPSTPQAGSGSTAEGAAADAARPADVASGSTAEAPGDPASRPAATYLGDLGDLGDLSTAAARRFLLAELDTLGAATANALAPAREHALGACPVRNVSSPVAYATGSIDGRRALVLITEPADGSRRVRLVISDPCEVRELR